MPLALQCLTPSYISVIGIGAITAAVMSSAEEHLAETGEGHPDDAKRYTVEKHAT